MRFLPVLACVVCGLGAAGQVYGESTCEAVLAESGITSLAGWHQTRTWPPFALSTWGYRQLSTPHECSDNYTYPL